MKRTRVRGWIILVALAGMAGLTAGAAFLWQVIVPVPDDPGTHGHGPAAIPQLPTLFPAPRVGNIRAAVLEEAVNRRYDVRYAAELEAWRSFIDDLGIRSDAPEEADVLILPAARCLGPRNRAAVRDHLERGGGVVTTGMIGSHDGSCRALPDTLLQALVGGPLTTLPAAADPPYLVVLGETLMGADLPPGARVTLHSAGQVVFSGPDREVFYASHDRRPLRIDGRPGFEAAVVRSRVSEGRVAGLGFRLEDAGDDWSRRVLRTMAANVLSWSAGRPVAHLAPWPEGKRAAAVLALDAEDEFTRAAAALAVLREHALPGTFFLVSDLARTHRRVARALADYGELGSHGRDHSPLDGFDGAEQERLLEVAQRAIERLGGREVVGMRPPEERYTWETLEAWARLGGDYVFTNTGMRAVGPEIVPVGGTSLVVLGRAVHDDFELLNRRGLRDLGEVSAIILEQLAEVVAYRGLFMFSYHTQILARDELLPVLRAVSGALAASPEIWTATAGEIATWWRTRAAVTIDFDAEDETVRLDHGGQGTLASAVLLVHDPDGTRSRIPLPDLGPGQTLRVPVPAGGRSR